jgi:hypothetical protein
LSAEWFDETRDLCEEPLVPGLSARLECEVTGGPQRSLGGYWVLEDGRLTDSGAGACPDPDVTITMAWDDALAVQRGELDPSVAFMRGRLKVAGSMGVMVDLLPAADAGREIRRRMAAAADL